MTERAIYEEPQVGPELTLVASVAEAEAVRRTPLEKNASKVLSDLISVTGVEFSNLSQEAASTYFEAIVAPAVGEAFSRRNAASKRPDSEAKIQERVNHRLEVMRDYFDGKSAIDIAAKTNVAKNHVHWIVRDTIKATHEQIDASHSYFTDQLLALTPNVQIGAVTPTAPQPKRVGSTAVRGAAKEGESPAYSTRETSVDRDLTGMYLNEIGRRPLLDAAKEVELSRRIEVGLFAETLLNEDRTIDDATAAELEWLAEDGRAAKTNFLESNLRLVVSIARKYGRAQMPMLDLVQEGNTGLIRAVEKFDYTKGYKFSTYATWWVRQAITRGIAQQARVVRLPVHVVEELNQVGGARRTLERQLGRDPEPEEIAGALGFDVDRVIDLIAWGRDHVSLDTPVSDDGDTSLGDLMAQETAPGPDETVINTENRARLESLVCHLDDRAADIIRHRYGLVDGRQHKLADIGARHGISAERVRQLEREALQKLRRIADPDLSA